MSNCTRGNAACQVEFRMTPGQMNEAIQRAKDYDIRNTPFPGVRVYPYVWSWQDIAKTIRMEMGHDEKGRALLALFTFEQSPAPTAALAIVGHVKILLTVCVHVTVWITEDPANPRWSAKVSESILAQQDATNHFRGTLLGVPGARYASHIDGDVIVPPPTD